MLALYWSRFEWNRESRRWLKATLAWWALLIITGIVAYLPGVLDRIKFTHVLVAHSHLAMAGFITSMNMLVLLNLSKPAGSAVKSIAWPPAFFAWQLGLALHLACLIAIGVMESVHPERWFASGITALLWARLGAGALMTMVSLYWAVGAHGASESMLTGKRANE
jgi:cytochrome c oxidase cbb3-type subunit 1